MRSYAKQGCARALTQRREWFAATSTESVDEKYARRTATPWYLGQSGSPPSPGMPSELELPHHVAPDRRWIASSEMSWPARTTRARDRCQGSELSISDRAEPVRVVDLVEARWLGCGY